MDINRDKISDEKIKRVVFFRRIVGRISDISRRMKAEKEEKSAILQNPFSETVCFYVAHLFGRNGRFYKWLINNEYPLYPRVHEYDVALCFMDKNGADVVVDSVSFREISALFGKTIAASHAHAYVKLDSKTKRKTLEKMINRKLSENLQLKKTSLGWIIKSEVC